MITLGKFKQLDQDRPIQMLLDDGGMMAYTTSWYDVFLHPTKDNVVMQWDAEKRVFHCIKLNERQDLRNTPVKGTLEIDKELVKAVTKLNRARNREVEESTEYLLKYSALKLKAQTYHKD